MPQRFCPRPQPPSFLLGLALLTLPVLLTPLACGNGNVSSNAPNRPLPAAEAAGSGGVGRTASTSDRTPDLAAAWLEAAIFEATNVQRRRHDRERLQSEDRLADIARGHSEAMLRRGFFDHVDPDGLHPADRVARQHRTLVGITGENLWTGTGFEIHSREDAEEMAERIVDGWMNSRGHRENILRAEFDHLGVGVVVQDRELRATQVFAGVVALLDTPLPERLSVGDTLRIRATASTGNKDADLWDLAPADGGESLGPWGMGERVELDGLANGQRYQLRLYLLEGVERQRKRYEVFSGPEVVVR